MDILIIGNGFDLAHGLKTSYGQFLEFCKEQMEASNPVTYFDYKQCLATNLWLKHFINKQEKLGDTWIDLEKEIYEVVKFINKHPIVTGSGIFEETCPQILTINASNNSFNFYSLNKDNNLYLSIANHNGYDNYEIIEDTSVYRVHFDKSEFFINFLYDQLREFTRAFEQYLINEIMAKLVRDDKYILTLPTSNTRLCVLSFNYTDTCFKLYDHSRNPYTEYSIETIFVHGKVQNSNDCELILGTKSFKSSDDYAAISPDFNIFKKHNQRHKYNTIEPYQELLRLIKLPNTNPVFHIIGHSLDESDRKILKHILDADKNAAIKVYYHDEESQERLINNITDIIGEEEVMTRVQLIDQHDEKRGILRPVERTVLTSY
ncbi:TPA: bacteriophage abortive infection AbiH family protein [Candidatus Galligastranaerophilus faecipullorum]|nr:bacteriophage abortive infection AbiH family protein [Candidatus Galligastranaerophilus faecipullorum]